jgi:hypothetical protein
MTTRPSRPGTYKVDGETVDIVYKATLRRFREGYPTAGKHTPETAKTRAVIEIGPGQTHEDERKTLLHEMLHDAAVRSGTRAWFKLSDEETFITAIEPWFFQMLVENPDVVAWMLEPKP